MESLTHYGPGAGTGRLAASLHTGLLVMTMRSNLAHGPLAVQLLFQPAQGLVDGFTFTYFYFRHGSLTHTPFHPPATNKSDKFESRGKTMRRL